MNNVFEVEQCEVCNNDKLSPVLNLGTHPLCDDLIKVGDKKSCTEYPIEINFCNTCKTAQQRYQVPKKTLFPQTYHYRSRFTGDVVNGMRELVESCAHECGQLENKKVLDIGCNDGTLLGLFREKGTQTFGIEPTLASQDAAQEGHTIYHDYLTLQLAEKIVKAHGKFDVITFTNVFAHIENLGEILEALKTLMSECSVLVVENHYLSSVLASNQFDTFYHEHPRTYSYSSFEFIAKRLGLQVQKVEFPSRYGGNIRVYIGNKVQSQHDLGNIFSEEAQYLDKFALLENNIEKWRTKTKEMLQHLVSQYGPLAAKAFPGRAAILIKILDLDHNILSCTFEKPGSMKIGHYIPGTRIPIKSDEELFTSNPQPPVMVNLAWHISGEIKQYLTVNGYRGRVIDILAKEAFMD